MRRDCAKCSPCRDSTRRSTDGEITKDLSEGSQSSLKGAARRTLWASREDSRGLGALTASAEVRQMTNGWVTGVSAAADSDVDRAAVPKGLDERTSTTIGIHNDLCNTG